MNAVRFVQRIDHRPAPPLSQFVELLWLRRGAQADPAARATAPAAARRRALPTGCIDVTFNLSHEPLRVFADAADVTGWTFSETVVHGPQSRYFVLGARRDVYTLGIHFRPQGAVLLGVAAHELRDRHAGLDALWGSEARRLRERLLEAQAPQAAFAVLERALLVRLQRARQVHPAVSFVLRSMHERSGRLRMDDLQAASGYGARRISEAFGVQVGLAPKLFSRVLRMRKLVEDVCRRSKIDWADVASEYGYCDQAHLAHDFRQFTGVAPTAYHPAGGGSPLHMKLED